MTETHGNSSRPDPPQAPQHPGALATRGPIDRKAVRDFGVRTVTAVILGTVQIAAVLWGGLVVWALVVSIIAMLAASEFYEITRTEHRKPNEVFGVAAVGTMPLAAALYATRLGPGTGAVASAQLGAIGLTGIVGILVVSALMWHLVFRQVTTSDTAVTVFGAVYVGFTLSHLVLINALDSGTEFVLATIVSVWANDVLAYAVGAAWGRHRLAPELSPKKSWEGVIAGTVGSVTVWACLPFIVKTALPWWWLVAIGATVSLASVLGDLAESRIKREAGVKDSGRYLPGHGGFLDRFDSTILVSIVSFYMLVFGLLFLARPS